MSSALKALASAPPGRAASVWRRTTLVALFATAVAALPPLPTTCAPFDTKGGQPIECTVELFAGYTYVMYTDCTSVKGDTQLTLRDPGGVDVAFNDGFPFCPGDTSASLVEFKVECGTYGTSAKFTLLQDCFENTDCGGSVVVEYSKKEPPVDCGRGPFTCTKQDATCEALGDLYYATNGAGWLKNDGWAAAASGIPTSYCSFYVQPWYCPPWSLAALTCNIDGVLTYLNLFNSNLVGTLPSSLDALTSLEIMDFTTNQLTGTIPPNIGTLTHLVAFAVGTNKLSDSIPASLGSLTMATSLILDTNNLSGSLPASIGSLTALTQFKVNINHLSGSVPASLISLSRLTEFYAGGSGLCGPVPTAHQPEDGPLPNCV